MHEQQQQPVKPAEHEQIACRAVLKHWKKKGVVLEIGRCM